MVSTLQDLIAPATQSEFIALLRDRQLSLRRANGDSRYDGLFDWATLRGLIESTAIPPARLRITYQERTVQPGMYMEHGKVDAARLARLIPQGISLVVKQLQRYAPAVNALCEDLHARLGDVVHATGIVTTGSGGAFPLHYDHSDVLVLQLQGSKRWRIHGSPVAFPLRGMPKAPEPDAAPVFDETLQPGDFLVMPGGYWHHCDNGPELSLHLSIVIRSPTGWHAVEALTRQLLTEDIFRVPLSRLDAEERRAHETALKGRLIELIEQASLDELVAKSATLKSLSAGEDD